MNVLRIEKWEFRIVYEEMLKRLKDEYDNSEYPHNYPKGILACIGHGSIYGKKDYLCLRTIITKYPAVEKSIEEYNRKRKAELAAIEDHEEKKISGHGIYEIVHQLEDKSNSHIELRGIYEFVFFKFLDVDDYNGFKREFLSTRSFKGYYFSLLRDRIDYFSLEIKNYRDRLRVSLKGLHNVEDRESELTGELVYHNQCWVAHLKNEEFFLDLSIHAGELGPIKSESLLKANLLHGVLSGHASGKYLLSMEVILSRQSGKKNESLNIERYINLRRNHFNIKVTGQKEMITAEELYIREAKIDRIDHMSDRRYRLLTAAPNGSIIQSEFVIRENYSAYIQVPEVLEPTQKNKNRKPFKVTRFNCSIPDMIDQDKLIVFSFRGSRTCYSFTALKIPHKKDLDKIIEGVFCIIDGDSNKNPIINQFVMTVSGKEFKPDIISHSRIENNKLQDEEFKSLVDRLDELDLRKVKKQRG